MPRLVIGAVAQAAHALQVAVPPAHVAPVAANHIAVAIHRQIKRTAAQLISQTTSACE